MKVLPGAEETGIGEKPTEEANKRVAEVLEQQQQPESTHKRKLLFTRARHMRRLSVNGMTMDFT